VVSADGFGFNLPNPFCKEGSNPNCANGNWQSSGYSSEYACNQAYQNPCLNNFPALAAAIIQYMLAILGTLSTIMLIYAGFLYVTSAGDEGRLGSAKKAFLYAIIGIAIILAGQGIIAVITAVIGTP